MVRIVAPVKTRIPVSRFAAPSGASRVDVLAVVGLCSRGSMRHLRASNPSGCINVSIRLVMECLLASVAAIPGVEVINVPGLDAPPGPRPDYRARTHTFA